MSIVKDTISITAITLVAGLALGVVQDITADPIAEQKMKAKQEAYKSVFPDADRFGEVELGDKTQELAGVLSDSGYGAQTIDEVMTAFDASDNEIGYAFTVTTSEGYGGDIQFAMGVQKDGTLNGR